MERISAWDMFHADVTAQDSSIVDAAPDSHGESLKLQNLRLLL